MCIKNKLTLNRSNKNFYSDVSLDLRDLADKSGLTTGLDIFKVRSEIEKSKNILEIGAGYGRAAKFIDKYRSADSHLYLIEFIPEFIEILRTQFNSLASVSILEQDFFNLSKSDKFTDKFDLILWMWSGFADFNHQEQQQAFCILKKILAKGGLIVIDLPAPAKTNATEVSDEQGGSIASIKLEGISSYQGFIPSVELMQAMIKESGLFQLKVEGYETTTQRARTQYFLSV